jgi:AsmA protein
MRRWGIAAGVALGAALGLSLGFMAWPVDPGHVAADFALTFGAVDAPIVAAPSAATLTLLPRPTVRMSNVKFRDPGGAASVEAQSGEATLRFNRLLIGQFSPSQLSLQHARVRVDLDAARAGLRSLARPPFPWLSLQGGDVEVASPANHWATRIEVSDALLSWPSATSGFRLNVNGRWRSQPVEATLELDAPLEAAQGRASPARIAVDAPLAQIRFAGDWSPAGVLPDARVFLGQVSALIPSVERFSRWLGRDPERAPSTLELEARASGDAGSLQLADARIVLGGQTFEGALDLLKTPGGLSASGSLAAETLDLEPLIGPPPTLYDESGSWSNAPTLPAPSRKLDLDMRVSATHVVWSGHAIENAAVSVSQRGGRYSVKLLEAGYAHGSLSGEVSVEDKQSTCETHFALALDNADFGALLSEFGAPEFSGQGSVKASIRARGRSAAEIVATADGEGTLEIGDGALGSVNFEEALRRGQRRPLDVARDMNAGATRFASARGRIEISHGEARFIDAGTQAPGVSLALTGALDLIYRAWRARLEARQTSLDGQPTPDGAHMDFALEGPWGAPVLAPLSPPAD